MGRWVDGSMGRWVDGLMAVKLVRRRWKMVTRSELVLRAVVFIMACRKPKNQERSPSVLVLLCCRSKLFMSMNTSVVIICCYCTHLLACQLPPGKHGK